MTTEAILSQLLREAMAQPEVHRALEMLQPEPVPWFGQIRQAMRKPQAVPPSTPKALLPLPPKGAPTAPPRKGEVSEEEMEAYLEEQEQIKQTQQRVAAAERQRRDEEGRQAVLDSAEFQELAQYVIEGTIFNLVSEAAGGEFDLDMLPRQIVKSLEIT